MLVKASFGNDALAIFEFYIHEPEISEPVLQW